MATKRLGVVGWYLIAAGALVVAIVVGAMVGPAGPPAWRVPLP